MKVTTVKIPATVSIGRSVSYPSGVRKRLWGSASQNLLEKKRWFPVGWEPVCIRDDLTEPLQAHIPGAACAQFSVTVFSLKFVSSLLARPSDDGREWKQTHPEKL